MTKNYVIRKSYQKYFGEIWDDVKTNLKHWNDFRIILFLGGKNRGKSYTAFQLFYDEIKKGNKVVYLRNSQVEIDKIKDVIGSYVSEIKGEPVKVTKDGVYLKWNNEIVVLFASSKSYNNLSGNTISYSLVFYDEYNQILTTDMLMLLENFLLSMNTIFRENPFKIVVCGNTKTKNNLFFNLYHIDADLEPNTVTLTTWNDYLLAIRYDDDIFKEPLGNSKDMEVIKDVNPELYNQMFRGLSYGFEDQLIINIVDYNNWTPLNKYLVFGERVYQFYLKSINNEFYYGIFFSHYFIDNNFEKTDMVYTTNLKYHYLFNFKLFEKQEGLINKLIKWIGQKRLFFNDFILYTFLTDNNFIFEHGWKNLV